MPNPRISPVILLSPVEEGYVAYNPALDRLHHLNPIAALLAELCDGSRSIEEIRHLAGPLLPQGKTGEIDRWIDEGIRAGLLLQEGSESACVQELSAAELSTRTKRLKENGEVQAAHLCAKRTIELKPDDWSAWYDLGEIAQCLGRRAEARAAYQKYLDANPDDGEIEHLLIALRDDAPPPRASDRAIRKIYKNFAASYESRMLEDLKYAGPERMLDAIRGAMGDRDGLSILDLGCGSGLVGASVTKLAAELIGVDVSPEMIELAQARNIYDRLEVAEITQWLGRDNTLFDLIISCDCLIYFGDLGPIACAAAKRLKQGGFLAMSMERGDRYPFHLTDTGRYTHHPDHVRDVAAKSGLMVAKLDENFLRMEYDEKVMGLYAVLVKRPNPAPIFGAP
jgi:predicted TPR repeat methyltransferase